MVSRPLHPETHLGMDSQVQGSRLGVRGVNLNKLLGEFFLAEYSLRITGNLGLHSFPHSFIHPTFAACLPHNKADIQK